MCLLKTPLLFDYELFNHIISLKLDKNQQICKDDWTFETAYCFKLCMNTY